MSPGDTANEFERLINVGAMAFHVIDIRDLDWWGQSVVKAFLDNANIPWRLGNIKVGSAYVLKINDPKLEYLDIYPDTRQFLWCTTDHRDSVSSDEASTYLLTKIWAKEILRQSRSQPMDYYDIIGVSPSANEETIVEQSNRLLDNLDDDSDAAERVREARDVLGDRNKRTQYDFLRTFVSCGNCGKISPQDGRTLLEELDIRAAQHVRSLTNKMCRSRRRPRR